MKNPHEMTLDHIRSVFFLGIGGIGMSAIARYFLSKKIEVSGYDKTETDLTNELATLGAHITYTDDLSPTKTDYDIIIYTPAIPKDSILLNYFQSNSTSLLKRSEVLGIITRDKKTIAVAGSHGKTTVSTMIAHLLRECGIDASAFLGGISVNFNSNYVYGESEYVVVEADEYDKSFLRLSPNIIVLTSIDTDHLDIYGSREHIVKTFQEFLDLLPSTGNLIYSENVLDQISVAGNKTQYGFKYGDIQATNVQVFPTHSIFTINSGTTTFTLNYNGRHNIENVMAAVSFGKTLGLSEEAMSSAIATFKGIKRRFELIYQDEKITFIDDYAHHPTEIEALLKSVREIYPGQRVLSIFQPHLFSRTKDLADNFAAALDLSDEIILLPIYPARELPIEGVTSDWLSKKLHKPVSVVEKTDVLSVLKARPCTIILTIGAGDISTLIPEIKKQYRDPS